MKKSALLLAVLLGCAGTAPAFAVGAIAVDDLAGSKPSQAGFGIGFGDTKESAMEAAMGKCEQVGNTGCKVTVWFEGCGAYASSNEKYGIGWGASLDEAQGKALDSCDNDSCRIVASQCND